jgi:hypothetical protein
MCNRLGSRAFHSAFSIPHSAFDWVFVFFNPQSEIRNPHLFGGLASTPPHLGSLQDEVSKPATLSNGMQIQVPQFIKEADLVKVNVATKKYMERVKR